MVPVRSHSHDEDVDDVQADQYASLPQLNLCVRHKDAEQKQSNACGDEQVRDGHAMTHGGDEEGFEFCARTDKDHTTTIITHKNVVHGPRYPCLV